ncbi:HAD family phosphatase [Clostridium chauvoei]|uniref:HAD family hydrolase n=1 Tax=Clostridium chauvoei TaxID=46867 RepID=UPI001C855E81|nr:HAD family phosphatase [Clostridium chauvoei]MBX7356899.1 HAD family phosphatase [Clostridium chauvoei]
MMHNIKAEIFDLDGTLVDSMWVWEQIDIDYLSSKGHKVPDGIKDEISHLSFNDTALYFKNRFSIEDSVDEIINCWNVMALDYYSNKIKLKKGVLEFFNKLKENNIKIGLATSNSLPLLEATLKNNNLYDYFDAITVTDEVKKSKANPDIYLLAAEKLNISPKDCIVFEDIVQAVNGAKLAGMKVVAIYDKSSENQKEDLISLADKYIYDYTELL